MKSHFRRIAEFGCMVCGHPAEIHHVHGASIAERGIRRGKGQKTSDYLAIPLCPLHHRGSEGVDGGVITVSEWEARFGTQADMVDRLCWMLKVDLWEAARHHEVLKRLMRKYRRPPKLLPRGAI